MINQSDLMLGNWVLNSSTGKYEKVKRIPVYSKLDAIPITTQLIKDIGFKYCGHSDCAHNYWLDNNFYVGFQFKDDEAHKAGDIVIDRVCIAKYLHELQNAYYLSMGKRLEVNL